MLEMVEDRVAIVPVESGEGETEGGIVIPVQSQKEKDKGVGVVKFVGPGRTLSDGKVKPMSIKVGDKVFYGSYANFDFEHDGVQYAIISEEDILCKIT